MKTDIICTISSAAGAGAIGVVRLTGSGSLELASKIFVSPSSKKLSDFSARYMAYGHIVDGDKIIDEVLAVYYNPPYSYTCEEMVEIFAHGNYIALLEIQDLLLKSGANMAEAGEFTKRAFLNGRIDLSQAEAVMDLISSKTKLGFQTAQKQLAGSLNHKILTIGDDLTDLLAQIEVVIDYPDEDVEIITIENITKKLKRIEKSLLALEESYQLGKIIKEGLKVVIAGRPNVGKSSLLNALLGEERAIVTDIAGTTRDVIDSLTNINGIAVRLLDTAGIRNSHDKIEQIGIERSKQNFNNADLILLVLDSSMELSDEDIDILSRADAKRSIVVLNKSDIVRANAEQLKTKIKAVLTDVEFVKTTAVAGVGIDELKDKISQIVYRENLAENEIITNERHYQSLVQARKALVEALQSLNDKMPLDIVEIDLLNVYNYIGEISGQSLDEDVVNRIFEKFCLGK